MIKDKALIEEMKNLAIDAARLAGDFIQQGASKRGDLNIEQKSLHDYVSEVDRGAETIIRDLIMQNFPTHAIIGEEFGKSQTSNAEFTWIIDPLDGTTNFIRGIPHYAVSIAVARDREVQVGVVYDPAKDELFCAVKGQGASVNGNDLRSSGLNSIDGALLSTGVPYSGELLEHVDEFAEAMIGLLQMQTSGLRRLGAAALDLAYVAAGRYDGFWEAKLKPWDIAAGSLLVTESGGEVSDFNGAKECLQSGNIIAGTPDVHQAMVNVVSSAYKNWLS